MNQLELPEPGQQPPDYGWVLFSVPYMPQVATVVDIDESGLSFIGPGELFREGDNLSLDLFFMNCDDFVLDLFCRVVSVSVATNNYSANSDRTRKFRVRFVDLDDTRRAEIKSIIESTVNLYSAPAAKGIKPGLEIKEKKFVGKSNEYRGGRNAHL